MASLLDGTATRGERAVVIGFQVAIVSLWLVFLGGALAKLPDLGWAILLLPAFVGIWLANILLLQYRDYVEERRKASARRGR
jgi:hypothetical protein